ncbi:SUN domain-containing protein 5 (Sad1 and UNC84 domain-containing protein 5) (Sperm-associated antigen 4-like protein) (Testis and spermatogenesis-related gene 4 protein) [Durusdinium trenchii]|uniref:SUN domain-containing protein 5 (Sad1 and UNC84 domain-containing protein 5) (Sperm-associated antigen 4-like protein) (Testis and spermatogenesis-related gene 4 protein) n=1 Tax=Durusdinium trenchii TaxID=1381693 RepID=A0ABP0IEN9_9DINO
MVSALSGSRAWGFARSLQELHVQPGMQQAKKGGTKRLGVAFAALCAAATGIPPVLGVALLAFLDADVAAPAAPMPLPTVTMEASRAADSQKAADALNEIAWKRLQRLEEAFATISHGGHETTAAVEAAERAREAERKAWVAAKAAEAAAQRRAEGRAMSTDPMLDLGVDWAAWKAGAEIDHSHTTLGLHRNFWSRVARVMTSFAPHWRMWLRASHPPEVVLAWETGPPSKCFAFEGQSAKVSILFWRPVHPSHVAIEQSPSWALDPRASPRNLEVYAWPTGIDEPYSVKIDEFEFHGGSQVFDLTNQMGPTGLVRGLQVRIQRNWGEDHTLLCRLRVFGNQSASSA